MTKFEKQFIRMIVDARIRSEEWEQVWRENTLNDQNAAMRESTYRDWCHLYDVVYNSGDRRMMNLYSDALLKKRDELEAAA